MSKRKFTFDEVKEEFERFNYTLLSIEYVNSKSKLLCLCPNDHKYYIEFRSFKAGKRCKRCRYESLKETSHFKSKEFIENRKINNIKKYGVDSVAKLPSVIESRKKTCLEKYGVEYYVLSDDFKQKSKDTCLEKYGVPNVAQIPGRVKKVKETLQNKYGVPWISAFSNQISKESQGLFIKIYDKIKHDNVLSHCYFGNLNKEFCISYNKTHFKYDFVNTKLKKCIEYNGSKFHAPDYLKDNDTGWFAFDKNKTAIESRQYDELKHKAIKERGYSVLIVWDYEYKDNQEQTIQKCLEYLKAT